MALADWSGTGFTLAADAATYRVGAKSVKCTYVSSGQKFLTRTVSFGDISTYTGAASGTPAKGTCGLWIYKPSADTISSMLLRLGSSASDYTEVTGAIFQGLDWLDDAWTYMLFDMDGGSETGAPDWTACDYARIEVNVTESSGFIYLDYFTISQSNSIGLNGLGARYMTLTETTVVE